MPVKLIAIVTDPIEDSEPIEEFRRRANGSGVEIRVIVPKVPETRFQDVMGDVDGPAREAEETLKATLAALRDLGLDASGQVGDSDPVLAAQDALREGPADEILIFEHGDDKSRWYEEGLFERAKEELEPPLRMIALDSGRSSGDEVEVVGVERAGAGTEPTGDPDSEVEISANLPRFAKGDLSGIAAGIAGTILAGVLAAVAASGAGPESGWKAVAIAVAIGISLVNLAHVVGLTLFQSVHYRGGFAKFFRTLSLVGTPVAVAINAAIVIFT